MASARIIAPLIAAIGLVFAPVAAGAAPGLNERVVSDPFNGIALYGYDPVAYFVDGKPVLGRSELEAEWAGAAWRFSSEANRAAFLSAPEVYAPKYGGYDPLGVAKGVSAAGHPLLFKVSADRLYLFRSSADRDAFASSQAADAAWPQVEATLTDY